MKPFSTKDATCIELTFMGPFRSCIFVYFGSANRAPTIDQLVWRRTYNYITSSKACVTCHQYRGGYLLGPHSDIETKFQFIPRFEIIFQKYEMFAQIQKHQPPSVAVDIVKENKSSLSITSCFYIRELEHLNSSTRVS